jgi:hypothetical protein
MAYLEHQHGYFLVLNIADQAIIADAVPPQILLLAVQWLPPLPRILGDKQPFTQETLNSLLGGATEPRNLSLGCPGDFDPPRLSGRLTR